MSQKTALIIDFDGVLVHSMLPMVNYISQTFKVTKNSAFRRIFRYSLKNKHGWVSNSLKNYHAKKFLKFLEKNEQVDSKNSIINEQMFEILSQIDCPKAILTTNYSFVCKQILGEKVEMFEQIIGFDTVLSKTKGLEFLFGLPQFDKEKTLLISDTIGDILEFQQTVPTSQIVASSWGFNPRPVLESVLPRNQVLESPQDLLAFMK